MTGFATARDAVFGGVNESSDRIYTARPFIDESKDSIERMDYFTVLNDHLTDGSHAVAPTRKRASDNGQIIAHLRPKD